MIMIIIEHYIIFITYWFWIGDLFSTSFADILLTPRFSLPFHVLGGRRGCGTLSHHCFHLSKPLNCSEKVGDTLVAGSHCINSRRLISHIGRIRYD